MGESAAKRSGRLDRYYSGKAAATRVVSEQNVIQDLGASGWPGRSGLTDSSEKRSIRYDSPEMKNPANVVAAIGLALGGVFGMLGTMVAERNLQAAFWAVTAWVWWWLRPCLL